MGREVLTRRETLVTLVISDGKTFILERQDASVDADLKRLAAPKALNHKPISISHYCRK